MSPTVARAEAVKTISIESFQRQAWAALNAPTKHTMLYGGGRSGKTYLILLYIVLRALHAPSSRHAILRYRFNHLRSSILEDTLPKLCRICWPGQKVYALDRVQWCAEFTGGGRVYFGGLDDKDRTEKILGQEFSTIFLNEVSQISYSARTMAVTRLAQDAGLHRKMIYDENPPMVGHWSERLFVKKIEPATGKPLENPENFNFASMHPANNPYLPEDVKREMMMQPPHARLRFWEGRFGQPSANTLWDVDMIDAARLTSLPPDVALSRVIVAVDPSGCRGPEDKRSDEVGIVVEGLGSDGKVYVLEDVSGRFGPGGEDGWGAQTIKAAVKWGASAIYGERNFGGAMVQHVISTARATIGGIVHDGSAYQFHEVNASSGKTVRAEPVGVLTVKGGVKFVGRFLELEMQLVQFTTNGYVGDKSPDRADAFVWGAYALGVVRMPQQGYFDYMEKNYGQSPEQQQAASVAAHGLAHVVTSDNAANGPTGSLVTLDAPVDKRGTICTKKGRWYAVEAGVVRVAPDDVEDLLGLGFRRAVVAVTAAA